MSDLVLIDIEDGLKRVVNNKKLYAKLLVKFKDVTCLSELDAALAKGDTEEAKNAAHTLKGLAANLSLIELQKQCLEMETQIKACAINPDQLSVLKNTFSLTMNEIDKVVAEYE